MGGSVFSSCNAATAAVPVHPELENSIGTTTNSSTAPLTESNLRQLACPTDGPNIKDWQQELETPTEHRAASRTATTTTTPPMTTQASTRFSRTTVDVTATDLNDVGGFLPYAYRRKRATS